MKTERIWVMILAFAAALPFCGCEQKKQSEMSKTTSSELAFDSLLISDQANQWFARALADLEQDGPAPNGDDSESMAAQAKEGHLDNAF